MATCPNCRTYTDDERAKGGDPFVCRKCSTPLSLEPVETGGKNGKASKGGKGKKGKNAPKGVMMPLESDVPLPKVKSEDEDAPSSGKKTAPQGKAAKSGSKAMAVSGAKKSTDEEDDDEDLPLMPKPNVMPSPPPKPSLMDGPLVLVGIGVGAFALGLTIGIIVF